MATAVSHPYYPQDSTLKGYVDNDWEVGAIFSIFGASIMATIAATRALTKSMNPKLGKKDQALAVWFVVSGAIHLVIEGYFSINHRVMPQMQDYLGQGWKEYSKSDSRYMTAEPFVVCMESVTAFAWGPLCLLTAWMILTGSPWRHATQALVSMGQFYGDFLYFTTNTMDYFYNGVSYSRPEALYYWGYFVGINGFWLAIPGYCVYSSTKEIGRAFGRLRQLEGSRKVE
ncbi:hypothetical protein FGG08_006535 [Glutinoglossum americanum]|uniref:EXPERA domain-containing protein n=1 Tax=Glutinoglossum americanum TaxID=1670608 RepID=A0A9P8I758_9PEZI|nr:hypothetical protein FGG08_006535 [Glutinoglossum americanum]